MDLGEKLTSAIEKSGLCDKVEAVDLPELGIDEDGKPYRVWVRTVRGESFKALMRCMSPASTLNDEGRALACGCVGLACDEKGQPIFTIKDVGKLMRWPIALTNRIMKAGLKLNGMSEEEQDELVKNSEATDSGTSN